MLHNRILCQIIVFCVSFKNYQERKEEITRKVDRKCKQHCFMSHVHVLHFIKRHSSVQHELMRSGFTSSIRAGRQCLPGWWVQWVVQVVDWDRTAETKKKGPQNQSWMTCVIKYWTTQYVVSHNHLLCQEENLDQQDTNTRLSKWNCCLLQKKTIKGGYIYCPPPSPGSHYH